MNTTDAAAGVGHTRKGRRLRGYSSFSDTEKYGLCQLVSCRGAVTVGCHRNHL
jgi:hypothetical protein